MSREQYGESRQAPSLRVVPATLSQPIPPIRHVVEHILPRQHVTLLGGHGGSGKSLLGLILAAHCAAGRAWGGLDAIQTPALILTMEDPADLVRLRLRRIVAEYGLPADVIEAGITIADGTNGVCLAHETTKDGTRHLAMTATYDDLRTLAAEHGLIIIDNASDAYAAGENDRRMVREFMAALARIARQQDTAVLLLAHIDKAAAKYGAAGNSYSGSTAWHNSARSRLALVDPNGRLKLHHEKANLGPRIDPIPLDWTSDGVLIPATGRTVSTERDTDDDAAVLTAIRAAIEDGAHVPAARTGPATALHVLGTYPDLPEHFRVPAGRKRFWGAITRLQRQSKIKLETITTPARHRKDCLVCADSDARAQSPIPPSRTGAAGDAGSPICSGSEPAQNLREPAHGENLTSLPRDGSSWQGYGYGWGAADPFCARTWRAAS